MTDSSPASSSDRKTGTVFRLVGDYGFISSPDVPKEDLYFKTQWFRGSPPLQEGETVTFQVKVFGDNYQAHYVNRPTEDTASHESPPTRPLSRTPASGRLFEWAYLGYLPNVLSSLKALALPERWEFKNTPCNPERPLPILFNYLFYTFERLVFEEKIVVNEQASLAAFNTGLVDQRYETIYALFSPNDDRRCLWQLSGFCIAGEGANGQNLVRHFSPLPPAAHYFDVAADLLYDTRKGKPELDWRHVIIDRIDRYPKEFLEDHRPPSFQERDTSEMEAEERKTYFAELGNAIETDNRVYRRIMNRVKDAVDLSIKRVSWNFKTGIPQYYPRVRHLV